jgi:hypothetical protein
MMVVKGMSFALLNPTKEVLYQVRRSMVHSRCWTSESMRWHTYNYCCYR